MNAKQFFCPDAFDLTVFGKKTDLESKVIKVEVEVNPGQTFEDKYLALLLNNKKIDLQS